MPPRISLRSRLEYDVDRVLKQLESSSNANRRFTSTMDAYDAIQRSNSSLKRQKKKPLEDAIDRVLLFHKQEADDSNDSEAAIEEAEAATIQGDDRYVSRQVTKLGHQYISTTGAANSAEQSHSKKRRLPEGSEGAPGIKRQTNGEGSTKNTVTTQKEQPASKSQKPSRFTVEHVYEKKPLGGLGDLLAEILRLLGGTLKFPSSYEGFGGYNRPTGIIISGPDGMGKRSLVQNIAFMLGVPLISLKKCFSEPKTMATMTRSMMEAFDAAIAQAPSIVFIDDIHRCMSKPGSLRHNDFHAKAIDLFMQQMERVQRSKAGGANCIAIATTSNIAEVNTDILTGGFFEETVQVKLPDYDARRDVLDKITRGSTLGVDVDLDEIARMTHGFVPAELAWLTNKAKILAANNLSDGDDTDLRGVDWEAAILAEDVEVLRPMRYRVRSKGPVSMDDFKTAFGKMTPSLRKEGFSVIPSVTWDQVGALNAARKQLQLSIIGPIKRPDVYKEFGLRQNAGVLLWGPPGCGKTLIAQAVANDTKASFILINGPELLNKYVGESERAVRELFQRARSSKPCILFFDEMDSVVPPRAHASTESGARVVNALLTELDGAQDRSGVYVIGTTNRPDMIDEAILRPGRLGNQIFIDLPTPLERVEILQAIYRTRHDNPSPAALEALAKVAQDPRCTDFSGADLDALHTKAAHSGLERWMQDEASQKEIVDGDWEVALNNTKASVKDPAAYRNRNRNLA